MTARVDVLADALGTAPEDTSGLSKFAPEYADGAHLPPKTTAQPHDPIEVSTPGPDGLIRPTEDERLTLRRVSGSIPWVAYSICLVEFAERASYYGCQFVFSNFIQFPLPAGGNGAGAPPRGSQETAGALNRGLGVSSALVLLFQFLAYCIPILGGWLADVHYGRYIMVSIGVLICGFAHLVLVVGAIPKVLQDGHGMAPFVIGLVTLAFGAGLFKSNLAPMLLDQDTQQGLVIKELKTGERVIMDPEVTAQRLVLAYYGLVNVGAFFGLATTYAEKDVGYWLAYLLPGIIYLLLPILLIAIYKKVIKKPPGGSQLGQFFKVLGICLKRNGVKKFGRKGFWDAAKPSILNAEGRMTAAVTWSDGFVEDVRRTIEACTIFLFFPIYNMNDGGIGNVQTSQGSSLTTNGAPNDLLNNFNPLTIIVAIPIISYGIYPLLRRWGIHFGPIKRITLGFFIASFAMVAGAVTQFYIYKTSPCGYYATGCTVGTGVSPISIWVQIIQYFLTGVSECFANVTALEVAYARAPRDMKGLVMSMYLFSNSLSAAIQEAVTPALTDPHLVWVFAGPAIAGAVMAVWFYYLYRYIDDEEYIREGLAGEGGSTDLVLGEGSETGEKISDEKV